MTKKKKLPPVAEWEVSFQFERVDFQIKARTKSEATAKALKRLERKSLAKLIDKRNSSTYKW